MYTRDQHNRCFEDVGGAFTPGIFSVPGRSCGLQTRVQGEDTRVWYSRSVSYPLNPATRVRAVLGTDTIAKVQPVRIMYQLFDAYGNTGIDCGSVAAPFVHYGSGSFPCSLPDCTSGIGECSSRLSGVSFTSSERVGLSLRWPDAITVAVGDFGYVQVQREPQWSQAGGWNRPTTMITQGVAFGATLPYEDVYIPTGASHGVVTTQVYLKTLMSEDTKGERQVAAGRFRLVYPAGQCDVASDSSRNGVFRTWERLKDDGVGQYGLFFMSGQVEGYHVHMVTIQLSCVAGTHAIGVQTTGYADSNGATSEPTAVFATSVGRDDGYSARAQVLVKATVEDVHVFAYPSNGRAHLNSFARLCGAVDVLQVAVNSISNSPDKGRSNVACVAAPDGCVFTPTTSDVGNIVVSVGHGTATDRLTVVVRQPSFAQLNVSDSVLSALQCVNGTSIPGSYQSARLTLTVDGGLDVTGLASFSSSNPTVAEVIGDVVIGRSAGTARISACGDFGAAFVDVRVEDDEVSISLVTRIVTTFTSADSPVQLFDSEDDVGYMYVFASYGNGDAHAVSASDLRVVVGAPDKVAYSLVGSQHRVSVVPDASAGSSCRESLLRVSLSACTAAVDTVEPPLILKLPEPCDVLPLKLSQSHITPPSRFAHSGALSSRAEQGGVVTQAMALLEVDGLCSTAKDLRNDARVHLNSSDPSCVEVVPDLASVQGFAYRALDEGACTQVVITATFTLGAFAQSTSAIVYIARFKSMSIGASVYPPCASAPAPTTLCATFRIERVL